MSKITWDAVGTRFFESGIDRGVLYVDGQPGVPWNGLTSVTENPSGGDPKPFYIDGVKYLNTQTPEEFAATITAFTYPDEFEACDGAVQVRTGLSYTQQRRKSFGLAYRVKIGNDTGDSYYKIHLVYGALAKPSSRNHKTFSDTVDPSDFSWDLTTTPPALSGYRRTAHVVIDSRYTVPGILSLVEDVLYGTDTTAPRLPDPTEIATLFDSVLTLTVTDNGDGTFTLVAPDTALIMLDDETWQLTWNTAVFIDDSTYTVSS